MTWKNKNAAEGVLYQPCLGLHNEPQKGKVDSGSYLFQIIADNIVVQGRCCFLGGMPCLLTQLCCTSAS